MIQDEAIIMSIRIALFPGRKRQMILKVSYGRWEVDGWRREWIWKMLAQSELCW
jgi:hypothetical protein